MSQIPPLIFQLESDNEESSTYNSIQPDTSINVDSPRNPSSVHSNEENDDLTPMSPNQNITSSGISMPIDMAQSSFSFLDHTETSITSNRENLNSSTSTQMLSHSSGSCNASTQTIPLLPSRCPSCHAFLTSSTSVERARNASSFFCEEHTMELNASLVYQRPIPDSTNDNFSPGSTSSTRSDGRTKPQAVVSPFLINPLYNQSWEVPALNDQIITSNSPSHQYYTSPTSSNRVHRRPSALNNFSAGTSPRSPLFVFPSPISDPHVHLPSQIRHPPSRYSVGVFGAAGVSPQLSGAFTSSPAPSATNIRRNPSSHSQTRPLSMIELERHISDVLCEMGDELMPSMAISQSTPSRYLNFRLITSMASGMIRRFSLSSSNSREATVSPSEAVRRSSVCESFNRHGSFSLSADQQQLLRNRTNSASYTGFNVENRQDANEPNFVVDSSIFDHNFDEVDG